VRLFKVICDVLRGTLKLTRPASQHLSILTTQSSKRHHGWFCYALLNTTHTKTGHCKHFWYSWFSSYSYGYAGTDVKFNVSTRHGWGLAYTSPSVPTFSIHSG